jgi:predicted dehydrogenase
MRRAGSAGRRASNVPIGLGIVGCGGAAIRVVESIGGSTIVRIVAVHDRNPARAAELGARAGAVVHPRLRSLLSDPAVGAVYVGLPHDLLAPTAATVLAAGRHVLVEKPLAISAAQVRRVQAAAKGSGRSVGVMFELRHVPAAVRAAELCRAGAIGGVRLIRIRTLIDKPPTYWESGPTGVVSDPWRANRKRAGGGIVLMNTIHQLDLVRAITGLEVTRVGAETQAGRAGVDVEDVAVATLRFGGEALGSLVASAHAPGAQAGEEIEIEGTEGTLRIPDLYGPAPRLGLFLRRAWGSHLAGEWLEIAAPPIDPWAAAVEAFASAISTGEPPVPGLEEADAALATVLAIYRSARTGTSVSVRPSLGDPAAARGEIASRHDHGSWHAPTREEDDDA